MSDPETTPPREAVRPAVVCIVWRDTVREFRGNNPISVRGSTALAIDDSTGGGLVARVRDAVFAELYERLTLSGYSDGQAAGVCVAVSDAAIRALGVTP